MTPPETGPVTTVPAPTTATAPQEGPRATSTLSRRGFAIRRVPTMRLADGPDGEYPYNRWMHFAGVDSTRVQVRGERVLYTAAGVILGGYTVYAFIGVFAFAQMAVDRLWVAIAAAAVIGTILIAVNLSIDRGSSATSRPNSTTSRRPRPTPNPCSRTTRSSGRVGCGSFWPSCSRSPSGSRPTSSSSARTSMPPWWSATSGWCSRSATW